MTSPYQVRPCGADRTLLQARVNAGNTPQKMVLRALIVLMAADGASNATIAEELGVCVDDNTAMPLMRLRYGGTANRWGFAIHLASTGKYEDSILPSGAFAGTPEDALDCACGLYLADPTAWLPPPTN